jgi:hypothetical protein
MRRWVRGYTNETPRLVFKHSYMVCSIGSAFAFLSLWRLHYYDSEMTKMKWLGGLIGFLESSAAIALMIVFCTVADIIGLGIAVLSLHVVHWFVLGIFWKPDRTNKERNERKAQKMINKLYPPLQRMDQTETPRFHVCLPDDFDAQKVDLTEKEK